MTESITVEFDEKWMASLTLGKNGGNLDLPDLKPCGLFKLLLAATGDTDIMVGAIGNTQVLFFLRDNEGNLKFNQAVQPGRSEIIPGDNPKLILSFIAIPKDQSLPVPVNFSLIRNGKEITFKFL